MPRYPMTVMSAVLVAVLGFTACGRKQAAPVFDVAPAEKSTKSGAKAAISPLAEAQRRLERKDHSGAVRALGTDRSAEALEFCLGLLTLDAQHIVARNDAVQLLAEWPDQHERIVAALAGHLERVF